MLPPWLYARHPRSATTPQPDTRARPQLELALSTDGTEDITWRAYGNLHVGLVGRRTLIALKLFAAVDSGPRSVHVQDLLALAPTDAELEESRRWVATQDAYEGFPAMIAEMIEHVRRHHP